MSAKKKSSGCQLPGWWISTVVNTCPSTNKTVLAIQAPIQNQSLQARPQCKKSVIAVHAPVHNKSVLAVQAPLQKSVLAEQAPIHKSVPAVQAPVHTNQSLQYRPQYKNSPCSTGPITHKSVLGVCVGSDIDVGVDTCALLYWHVVMRICCYAGIVLYCYAGTLV